MTIYTHKMVNGVRVNLTAAEIAEFEERDRRWALRSTVEPTPAEKVAAFAKRIGVTVNELKSALR